MDKSKFYFSDGTPFYGIFKEIPMSGMWSKGEEKQPLYTIEEVDTDLPSAHYIYMNSVNEYDAAMKLVPTWAYWKQLLKGSIKVRRQVEDWREEKMLRDQAKAKNLLWEQAEKGNFQAQRVLYESKKEESDLKRQRRNQEERQSKEKDVLEGTLERLSKLKVVK